MGGKKESPKPPTVSLPGPTDEEKALMAQQTELIKQMIAQGGTLMDWSGKDRDKADAILNTLSSANLEQNPLTRKLTDQEMAGINEQYNITRDNFLRNFNEGTYKNLYDKTQADTIASLASRGVLDSRTGRQTLGDLEKNRQSDLLDAESNAALLRTQLEQQLRANLSNTDMGRAQLYSGLSPSFANTAINSQNSAGATGSSLMNTYAGERYAQANVAAQNAQSQYLWRLSNYNKKSGGMGSALGALGGAAIGGLLALPTGGLSIGAGAALGGTLGGAAGSLF